ncbi:MAG: hypothetical protein IJ300_12725 [Clostridia bacterium]|nr:hypothetical protein [Clostridia bacterium]
MNFKHFLITRFNIKIASVLTKQLDAIDISTDEKYLTERFKLFFDYTVPSVKAQSEKNFEWIVMFSSKTPDKFKQYMTKLSEEMSNLCVLYVDDNEEASAVLNREITRYDVQWCITSRVDNDDALATNYIESVQTYIKSNPVKKYALIFNNGYQYEERLKIASKYYFPKNHFSTLIAPCEKVTDTILNYGHMDIDKHLVIIEKDSLEPMWLEVVHGSNVSNRLHIKSKDSVKDVHALQMFGICNKEIKRLKFTKFYTLLSKPANAIRIIKQYGVCKIVGKIIDKLKKS